MQDGSLERGWPSILKPLFERVSKHPVGADLADIVDNVIGADSISTG